MRKFKNVLPLITFTLVMLVSFNVNSQSIFSEYENLGNIHNQFLDNVENNFNPVEEKDNNKKIDLINKFNINFAEETKFEKDDKTILIKVLSETKFNVNTIKFYNNSFDSKSGIYVQLADLKNKNIIDDFSSDKLLELVKACEKRESLSELIVLVDKLKKEANSEYKGKNRNESRILAMTLQIASSSFEWWNTKEINYKKNLGGQQSINNELFYVAPWVAADAIGGAVSATIAAAAQYTTTGEVGNWGAVGVSALGGAVSASTGVVGKLVKWFGW